MSNYLETIYFRDEYGPNEYPQKHCKHIAKEYYGSNSEIKDKKLLDIGSGKGNHLIGFSRVGLKVYGCDLRPECLEILKDFDIRECDLENGKLPFEDNYFDFVYSKSVLEHVKNTDNFLNEVRRVLKPGGTAVLLTPDWKSQHEFFWDDYTHVKPFTRKGLQDALVMHNFKKAKCEYFFQLPFLWKYSWLKLLVYLISLLPAKFKWKDKEEKHHRPIIRFCKEKMLLAVGQKSNE